MKTGDIVKVRVVAVHSYGIDVEAEGRMGFVQPIEVSWDDTKAPADVASPGTELDALVYAIADDRFFASIREANRSGDPWREPTRYAAGTVHQGTVSTILSWGTSVELAPGVRGVILEHESGPQLQVGDRIAVRVREFDLDRRRITLELVL